MTPSEMLTLLGYRLEDPQGDVYTTALKVLMINRAQARVYTELNEHVVPELMEKEAAVSLTSGAFDQTGLTYTLLGGISGGVDSIRLVDYDFTHKISLDEWRESVSRSITYTSSSGKHYFLGSKCYVLPDDYDVDVYYKRQPVQVSVSTSGTLVVGQDYIITTFVAGDDFANVGAASNATGVVFTATGTTPTTWSNASTLTVNAFTVASELVLDAVAYMAESLCWHVNNDSREGSSLEQAASLIETLNTTITATDANDNDDEYYYGSDSDYILPISTWES